MLCPLTQPLAFTGRARARLVNPKGIHPDAFAKGRLL